MKQLTGYMHGVNLGGWLSQCNYEKKHCDTFIQEADIIKIKSWGMDHVRLPVDYNLFMDTNGEFLPEGFAYVDSCIEWCKKAGLNIVLDLHKTLGYSFDSQEGETGLFSENSPFEKYFLKLWQGFTDHYAKYEDMLCFELLNEVTSPSFSKPWNALAKKCIQQIRKTAPTIKILVGSYWNNSVSSVKDLDPPYDENIVYNFHCYDPIIFTHQGGGWVSPNMGWDFRMPFASTYADYTKLTIEKIGKDQLTFENYPQNETPDYRFFENHFVQALKVAEERNVILYCGEYGVIDHAAPKDILAWYKEISKVFDAHGIGRSAWSYKGMNFGLSDSYLDGVRDELLKYL